MVDPLLLVVSVTLASVVGLFIYLLFSQSRAPNKIIEELAGNTRNTNDTAARLAESQVELTGRLAQISESQVAHQSKIAELMQTQEKEVTKKLKNVSVK